MVGGWHRLLSLRSQFWEDYKNKKTKKGHENNPAERETDLFHGYFEESESTGEVELTISEPSPLSDEHWERRGDSLESSGKEAEEAVQ